MLERFERHSTSMSIMRLVPLYCYNERPRRRHLEQACAQVGCPVCPASVLLMHACICSTDAKASPGISDVS